MFIVLSFLDIEQRMTLTSYHEKSKLSESTRKTCLACLYDGYNLVLYQKNVTKICKSDVTVKPDVTVKSSETVKSVITFVASIFTNFILQELPIMMWKSGQYKGTYDCITIPG
jgi:hypothetical protein